MKLAKQLFQIFCDSNVKLGLIIDGLDECSETDRKVLLEYLNTLVEETASATPGKLRVLIVSQQYGDIRKLLSSAVTLTVELEHNGDDIHNYIDYRMTAIAQRFDLDEHSKMTVAELIYMRSSGTIFHTFHLVGFIARIVSYNAVLLTLIYLGMFLFAELVLKNLRAQPTKEAFLKEISKDVFPNDLQGA